MADDPNREPFFDRAEARIVTDPGPFLLRTGIRNKIKDAFKEVREGVRSEVSGLLEARGARDPRELFDCPPASDFLEGKLSHGDHFRSLPWVYLDFPRSLGKENRFLFRSFFWWGNFIAYGWILEGVRLEAYRESFARLAGGLPDGRYVLSLGETPWDWGAERAALLPVRGRTLSAMKERLRERPFLKISRLLPLSTPSLTRRRIVDVGLETFRELLPIVLKKD